MSTDGRGRALDNVFVERLWRAVKYEDVSIQGYEEVPELRRGLARCAPWKGVDLQWVQFPPGNWVAPAGSYRGGGGGNKTVGAFETDGPLGGSASRQAVT